MKKNITPNHTQIPNGYLDVLMPILSEAEFKCLIYIARRTFGFHKRFDKISISQMTKGIKKYDKGTGLSRQSVVTATNKLHQAKIIQKTQSGGITKYKVVQNLDYQQVVQNLDGGSLKFRPQVVQNLDTQKKGNKVLQKKVTKKQKIQKKTDKFVKDLKKELTNIKINKSQIDELKKFVSYWTEPNRSKTKLRWELQPTWDMRRRVGTWMKNQNNWNIDKKGGVLEV